MVKIGDTVTIKKQNGENLQGIVTAVSKSTGTVKLDNYNVYRKVISRPPESSRRSRDVSPPVEPASGSKKIDDMRVPELRAYLKIPKSEKYIKRDVLVSRAKDISSNTSDSATSGSATSGLLTRIFGTSKRGTTEREVVKVVQRRNRGGTEDEVGWASWALGGIFNLSKSSIGWVAGKVWEGGSMISKGGKSLALVTYVLSFVASAGIAVGAGFIAIATTPLVIVAILGTIGVSFTVGVAGLSEWFELSQITKQGLLDAYKNMLDDFEEQKDILNNPSKNDGERGQVIITLDKYKNELNNLISRRCKFSSWYLGTCEDQEKSILKLIDDISRLVTNYNNKTLNNNDERADKITNNEVADITIIEQEIAKQVKAVIDLSCSNPEMKKALETFKTAYDTMGKQFKRPVVVAHDTKGKKIIKYAVGNLPKTISLKNIPCGDQVMVAKANMENRYKYYFQAIEDLKATRKYLKMDESPLLNTVNSETVKVGTELNNSIIQNNIEAIAAVNEDEGKQVKDSLILLRRLFTLRNDLCIELIKARREHLKTLGEINDKNDKKIVELQLLVGFDKLPPDTDPSTPENVVMSEGKLALIIAVKDNRITFGEKILDLIVGGKYKDGLLVEGRYKVDTDLNFQVLHDALTKIDEEAAAAAAVVEVDYDELSKGSDDVLEVDDNELEVDDNELEVDDNELDVNDDELAKAAEAAEEAKKAAVVADSDSDDDFDSDEELVSNDMQSNAIDVHLRSRSRVRLYDTVKVSTRRSNHPKFGNLRH